MKFLCSPYEPLDCEGQCAPSPRWAAKGQCACRHTSFPGRAPRRYSLPQPRAALLLFKPESALPRRHCQRPQLVKGKWPQGSRVTVQIKQYFLCFPEQLASCSSPAATASRLTSSMLPHASLLCRRRKPVVETCVDNTAKLRPKASVLALRPSTCRRRKLNVEPYVDNTAKLRPQASVLVPRPCTCRR